MPKKLEITIGPRRDLVEIAHVNDSSRPTIIDSDLFVGRVLVKIKDFDGITPDGSPPIRTHEYFDKRNRRFDIQIEGRFKARPGVAPYRGDEIQFGSDFDKLVSFPMTPFKLGLSVARTIDPNTFYEFEPPSKRPYIMSPYVACMNTFSAWPSPEHYKDALVSLQHPSSLVNGERPVRPRSESVQDMVPVEASRQTKKYWHFIGLKRDPKIQDLAAKNAKLILEDETNDETLPNGSTSKRPLPVHQVSFGARHERDEAQEQINREKHAKAVKKADKADKTEKPQGRFAALTSKFSGMGFGNGSSQTAPSQDDVSPVSSEADDELTSLPPSRNGLNGTVRTLNGPVPELKGLAPGDLAWAGSLHLPEVDTKDPIEAQIGPWRFENPAAEPMEDNTFVFLDQNLPVAKRRKYFSKSDHLKQFTYDPEIVYGASFFSPFMDFNTFDLAIGPVHMNIAKYFTEMPVRYTLRSSRIVEGTKEEEVFVTIAFRLVDV